jgi:hypothetical protein
VSGTVIGAVVTYVGNERLQNHQLNREEARQATAERAVVRLLMSEYRGDAGRLTYMISGRQYDVGSYRQRAFVSRVGLEDRKLLAGRLSEKEWDALANASQAVESVEADLEQHRGHGQIDEEGEQRLQQTLSACRNAYEALRPEAEGSAS